MTLANTIRWLLFGLGFWGCAELGHFLSFPDQPNFATFWPASGLYLAMLAMRPKSEWWGYVTLAVAANGWSEWLRGTPWTLIFAYCTANTLEAVIGGTLLQQVRRRTFQIENVYDVVWTTGLGALLATLAGAVIGGAAVSETLHLDSLGEQILLWWISDVIGVLAVAPLLLTLPMQLAWRRACGPKVWLEASLLGVLIVLSSLVAFGPKLVFQRSLPAYPFVVAPFLIWCGLRFGQFGTAVGVFLASVVAVWGTTRGYGLFAHVETTLEMKAAALQIYVMVVTTTPLMFAVVIQQQQMAEDRLTQNLKLLQAVMDGTSDAVFVKDLQGRYLLINAAGASFFSKTVDEVVGRDDQALFDTSTARSIAEQDRQTIARGQTCMYEAMTAANGRPVRHLHTTQGPYRDANGRIVGVVGIARDVTERRLAQQALQEAKDQLERRVEERTADLRQEMAERARAEERLREQQSQLAHAARLSNLGEMAAELAHEVNQPLSAISSYVLGTQRRLRAGSLSIPEIEPTLDIIGKEAHRAAEVIRRIKSFVRKQAGARTPLDLGTVIREAIALIELDLRERAVQWEVKLPASLPKCVGDAVQLQQVIVNLILNAADALRQTATARRVQVTVQPSEEFVEVAITDNGPGMPPDTRERIFDAFFSTKADGLGLGLTISRGIIETHGGRLWVDPCPVVGACLRFTLPVWEGLEGSADDDAHRVCGG